MNRFFEIVKSIAVGLALIVFYVSCIVAMALSAVWLWTFFLAPNFGNIAKIVGVGDFCRKHLRGTKR